MFFLSFLDLLFPRVCYFCHSYLYKDHKVCETTGFLCDKCIRKFVKINNNDCCKVCGYPIMENEVLDKLFNKYINCPSCEDKKRNFDLARSVYQYNNITRKMILSLKYYFQTDCIPFIGSCLMKQYLSMPCADIISFVPVTRSKLFFNGFNHAGLIANSFFSFLKKQKSISNNMHELYIYDLFVKKKKTIQSKKLSRNDRMIKQHNFEVNKKYQTEIFKSKFAGKTFLIIDDVITTGGTMDAIAKLLKDTFPKCNVECLSFGRTMLV